MEKVQLRPAVHLKNAEDLRALSNQLSHAAIKTALEHQDAVLSGAERLDKIAATIERKAKAATAEPSVAVLPPDANEEEVRKALRIPRKVATRSTAKWPPSPRQTRPLIPCHGGQSERSDAGV